MKNNKLPPAIQSSFYFQQQQAQQKIEHWLRGAGWLCLVAGACLAYRSQFNSIDIKPELWSFALIIVGISALLGAHVKASREE